MSCHMITKALPFSKIRLPLQSGRFTTGNIDKHLELHSIAPAKSAKSLSDHSFKKTQATSGVKYLQPLIQARMLATKSLGRSPAPPPALFCYAQGIARAIHGGPALWGETECRANLPAPQTTGGVRDQNCFETSNVRIRPNTLCWFRSAALVLVSTIGALRSNRLRAFTVNLVPEKAPESASGE